MLEAAFAIPGDLATPTGGYAYDRRVIALLPEHGVRVHRIALPASFPDPSDDDLAASERLLRAAVGEAVIVDGLAYGAMPPALIASIARPAIALVHHPLALETGLSEARRAALLASERAALALARYVVVTSAGTARLLARDFGVAADAISVAEPGVDPAPRAAGSGGGPPHILAVDAVVPRKGYDVLVAALARIAGLDWRLTIVGALDRAPAHAADLRQAIVRAGLAERIALSGALDDATLARAYHGADLFVLSSWYEGYGMVLTEAMARGLAIVATCAGAAEATVPAQAAVKVQPGDAAGLAEAIARLLREEGQRRRLAEAAYRLAQDLPRWSDTAARIARVVRQVTERSP